MNVLDALAHSHVINKMESIKKDFSPYLVKDLVSEHKTVIFVFESPHTSEVKNGYPLAGNSGKSVTKVLNQLLYNNQLDCDQPFGACLSQQHQHFQQLGIMNVCQIPLQSSAYPRDIHDSYLKIFTSFETLRSAPQTKKRKIQLTLDIEQIIVHDLVRRFSRMSCQNPLIIPCGNVARAFLKKCGNLSFFEGIPHPSYGQWGREDNQPILRQMSEAIINR
ncbi:hypothetical protein WDW89_23815 [Deltaproteobacteria bacterium TL4]